MLQLGPEWEILVVDDASGDNSVEIVETYPFRLFRQPRRSGQSAARNQGIERAEGDILVFLDSDVLVEAETLRRLVTFLEERAELDGVFGCYSQSGDDDEPAVSRFRNLLHSYVHRCSTGAAKTFWAGLGGMRRHSLVRSGGFDSRLDGIEDVELGTRISRQGGNLWLNPGLQGQHLKRWSLSDMIYTDTCVRAAQWTYYGWLGLMPKKGLNLSPRFSLPPLLLVLTAAVVVWRPDWALALLLAYLVVNLPTYFFFKNSGGWRLSLLAVFYLILHHLCCLIGATLGTLRFLLPS